MIYLTIPLILWATLVAYNYLTDPAIHTYHPFFRITGALIVITISPIVLLLYLIELSSYLKRDIRYLPAKLAHDLLPPRSRVLQPPDEPSNPIEEEFWNRSPMQPPRQPLK